MSENTTDTRTEGSARLAADAAEYERLVGTMADVKAAIREEGRALTDPGCSRTL